jgi:hypothetical protein
MYGNVMIAVAGSIFPAILKACYGAGPKNNGAFRCGR